MYILFCEDLGDKAPDFCYLRLIDTHTNTITRRGRHTWFSLLKDAKYDLLTDNLRRALNCAYVWEPLENRNANGVKNCHISPQRVRRPYLLKLIAESFSLSDQLATGRYPDIYAIRNRAEKLARKLKAALDQEARFEAGREK